MATGVKQRLAFRGNVRKAMRRFLTAANTLRGNAIKNFNADPQLLDVQNYQMLTELIAFVQGRLGITKNA